jgi:hypothetical protein
METRLNIQCMKTRISINFLALLMVLIAVSDGLTGELPDGYPRGFDRLQVVGPCGYSYGIAFFAGEIYYTDFNAQSVFRLNAEGKPESVLRGIPGLYGLAAGDDVIFYATDGDEQNAAIHRFTPGGQPQTLASGFTRPRQLFVEEAGTLLVALEAEGRIIRLDPETKKIQTLADGITAPQAAVSDGNSIFFTEYGTMKGDGTPVVQGQVSLAARGEEPKKALVKVWRARGLALLSPGQLAVLSEADQYDRGNSASFLVFDYEGQVSLRVDGFDYPQFTALDPQGNVLTTAPRDRVVLRFLTSATSAGEERLVELGGGFTAFAAVHGSFADRPGAEDQEIRILGGKSGPVVCSMRPDEKGRVAGWVRISPEEFPDLSRQEMKYPDVQTHIFTPGVFEVPELRVETGDGQRLSHRVLAQRSHTGKRWPMTNVGDGDESAAPGFSEEPSAYLLYFEGETKR